MRMQRGVHRGTQIESFPNSMSRMRRRKGGLQESAGCYTSPPLCSTVPRKALCNSKCCFDSIPRNLLETCSCSSRLSKVIRLFRSIPIFQYYYSIYTPLLNQAIPMQTISWRHLRRHCENY